MPKSHTMAPGPDLSNPPVGRVPGRTAAHGPSPSSESRALRRAPKPQRCATTRANRRAQSRSRLQLARSPARSLRGLYQEPGARRLAARPQGSTMLGSREPRWRALPCRPFCRRHNALARGGIKPGHFRGRTFSKSDSKRDGRGCSRWRFTQRFDGLSSSKGKSRREAAGVCESSDVSMWRSRYSKHLRQR